MKKKNNEEIIVKDVDNIPIVPDEESTPKRKWNFFKRREKGQPKEHRRIQANELSGSAKKSMVTRIISAVVGLAIIVPAIFLGDWIYFGVITFALGVACYEVLGCTNKRTIITVFVYFLFVALIVYWPIFLALVPSSTETPVQLITIGVLYQKIYIPILVVAFGSFLVFFLTVIYKDFTVHDACYLIAMAIIVGLGFQCLFFLRYFPNNYASVPLLEDWTFTIDNTIKPSLLLVFVIFSTFMTDTGAYFVGVFFGKNKMNERISPKKTWEGFVGGVVISFVLSSALALTLSAVGWPIYEASDPDTKAITISFALDKNWYLIFILSALIPIFATLGDFVFSSIKRYWGIKDYGKLIPGHGGVLDRLDSIIFAAIITAIFIHMLNRIGVNGFDWAGFLV